MVVVGNAISRGNRGARRSARSQDPLLLAAGGDSGPLSLWAARSVVIAGTHGKTTTTSLAGWLLTHGGADPSVLVGGIAENFDGSFARRRARFRHRRRRIRQRVLRQDRQVPEVSARHRRRQQHRVRSRRHLCGSRRDPPGVSAVRQPRARAAGCCCSAPTTPDALALRERAHCRVETFGLSDGADLAGARSRDRRDVDHVQRSARTGRRSAPSRCRCLAPTTCATRWRRSRSGRPLA